MKITANMITKQYNLNNSNKRIFEAISAINFSVNSGELVVITGRSGSGKSTLLNIMAGLLKPTSGTVLADQNDIYGFTDKELSDFRHHHMGIIPQTEAAIYSLNVEENIKFYISGKEKNINQKCDDLLEKLGISNLKKAYPTELSGGELHRMSVARALVRSPEILFADEPTSDLDSENVKIVINLLRKSADEGAAVLVVTHESDFIPYADKHYIMEKGHISKA